MLLTSDSCHPVVGEGTDYGKTMVVGVILSPPHSCAEVIASRNGSVTHFKHRIFTDGIKFRGGRLGGPSSDTTGVLRKRGNSDTCGDRGRDLGDAVTSQQAQRTWGSLREEATLLLHPTQDENFKCCL